MTSFRPFLSLLLVLVMASPANTFAASHREAPIVSLDQKANITDIYAFMSYDNPTKATFILNVDPFLEPSNGPNCFQFDPNLFYAIRIDRKNNAIEDITFEIRFQTQVRAPNLFAAFAAGIGFNAPANSPIPVAPGTSVVPRPITALDGPGSEGLNLRQTYTVTMIKNGVSTQLTNTSGQPLFAAGELLRALK